jgi:hypothetical protein
MDERSEIVIIEDHSPTRDRQFSRAGNLPILIAIITPWTPFKKWFKIPLMDRHHG